jgi:hypothetical protein
MKVARKSKRRCHFRGFLALATFPIRVAMQGVFHELGLAG